MHSLVNALHVKFNLLTKQLFHNDTEMTKSFQGHGSEICDLCPAIIKPRKIPDKANKAYTDKLVDS